MEQYYLNYTVQGTGADILKDSLIAFYDSVCKLGIDAHVINVVHDEIIVECNDEDHSTVAILLKEAMEGTAEKLLRIPVPVDIRVGKNWSDIKG